MPETAFPDPIPRFKPYVAVTWLVKLLAGENHCEWALWFKSRFEFVSLPDSPDMQKHRDKHDALMAQRIAEIESVGLEYSREQTIRTKGKSGTMMSGKADIMINGRDQRLTIEECKGGKALDSHHVQVLLYILMLHSEDRRHDRMRDIDGTVVRPHGVIEIVDLARRSDVAADFKGLMARIQDAPPPRKPEYWECRFCPISAAYCADRIVERGPAFESANSWPDDR